MKVIILGANGMLGHKLFETLIKNFDYKVIGTIRKKEDLLFFSNKYKKNIRTGITSIDDIATLFNDIKPNLVINCIGNTTKYNNATNDLIEMINVNSILPHKLLLITKKINAKLIHISTDCVFSGKIGNYNENNFPDPVDEYGRSKLLGEFMDPNNLVIRTSIIGHELNTNRGLLEWFLSVNDECNGYRNSIFSGLTTLELSKVIGEYIIPRNDISGLINISSKPIAKVDLLKIINKIYNKNIRINALNNPKLNRSLDSTNFYNYTKYICPDWENLVLEMFIDQK